MMLPAFGLYTHIRANRIRSAFLIGTLFAMIYVLTYAGALAAVALNYNWGLPALMEKAFYDALMAAPFVTVGTLIWIAIAYFFNHKMIDAVTGAREVTREQEPKLYNLTENLCISRGMTMPRLEIMETDTPNAFASGMNDRQYAVIVTRGLMDMMNDDELEAVIAHELTHIRNGDVRLMVVAVIIAGVIAFFAELIFRFAFYSRRSRRRSSSNNNKGSGGAGAALLIAIVIVAVTWFLAMLIRFALSRAREYLADAGAADLTKNPDAMISALRKIEDNGELDGVPSGVMEMCLENPRKSFADLFSTHPSVDKRVDALVVYCGGREDLPEPTAQNKPLEELQQSQGEQQSAWTHRNEPAQEPAAQGNQGSFLKNAPWGRSA